MHNLSLTMRILGMLHGLQEAGEGFFRMRKKLHMSDECRSKSSCMYFGHSRKLGRDGSKYQYALPLCS